MDNNGFPIERTVTLKSKGKMFEGRISIGSLSFVGRRWVCRWSFEPFTTGEVRTSGEDALQALLECLRGMEILMEGAEEQGISVFWLEEGDRCGLPINREIQ